MFFMKVYFLIQLILILSISTKGQVLSVTEAGLSESYLKIKPKIRQYLRSNQADSVVVLGEKTWNDLDKMVKANQDSKIKTLIHNIQIELSYDLARGFAMLKNKEKTLYYLAAFEQTGFNNPKLVRGNTLFDFVSDEKRFQSIVKTLRERGDYQYILQKYARYENKRKVESFNFTYESFNSEYLVKIRQLFNLDSIAGGGDEISQITRLMKWVHDIIRHDGSSLNPERKNAFDIINVCKIENRGVNCRMMATVLNEVYLAMGFYSRHLTCMPKDNLDSDCHVVNMVFSRKLNHWIYVDPTFEVLLQDQNGQYLSPEAIRKRMVSKDSIHVANTLNWNGKPYNGMFGDGKSGYLEYMTKNFFWFTCPIDSRSSYETNNTQLHYIGLVPVGFKEYDFKVPAGSKTQVTNQPAAFWKSPIKR